jgi:NitT/TauT family transport system permease protein
VQLGLVVLGIVLIDVGWQLAVVAGLKPYILPSPRSVANDLWAERGILGPALWGTLQETIYGFLIATGFGIAVAFAIASSKVVERMVYPLLVVSNAVPKIALAPIFIAWFGLGSSPHVVVATLLAVFPIVISTAVGLVGVDPGLITLGRSANAGRFRVFRLIRFPAALPSIFGGLKLGVTLALTGAVVGEFVGGNVGLGYVITNAQGNLLLSRAFAAIVLLAAIGIALFYLVELLERIVIPRK